MHKVQPPLSGSTKRNLLEWTSLGCTVLLAIFVTAVATFSGYVYLFPEHYIQSLHWPNVKPTISGLRVAFLTYKDEYNRFPVPDSDSRSLDLSIRSRGQMLLALIGAEATELNPHGIQFLELPMAKNRELGLWLDGSDWVLTDRWGEPYYIVLDTNRDGTLTNPEFGADVLDSKYAKRVESEPPPAELKDIVAIYSAGADRDPETWHDNITSWR